MQKTKVFKKNKTEQKGNNQLEKMNDWDNDKNQRKTRKFFVSNIRGNKYTLHREEVEIIIRFHICETKNLEGNDKGK